jgi:hypothetical protein
MKVIAISLFLLSMSFASVGEAIIPKTGIKRVSSNKKDRLVFRVEKKFKGAEVEVLSITGQSILRQTLLKRKAIIDFGNVKSGTYIIKVKKGMLVKQFEFQRK